LLHVSKQFGVASFPSAKEMGLSHGCNNDIAHGFSSITYYVNWIEEKKSQYADD